MSALALVLTRLAMARVQVDCACGTLLEAVAENVAPGTGDQQVEWLERMERVREELRHLRAAMAPGVPTNPQPLASGEKWEVPA